MGFAQKSTWTRNREGGDEIDRSDRLQREEGREVPRVVTEDTVSLSSADDCRASQALLNLGLCNLGKAEWDRNLKPVCRRSGGLS